MGDQQPLMTYSEYKKFRDTNPNRKRAKKLHEIPIKFQGRNFTIKVPGVDSENKESKEFIHS